MFDLMTLLGNLTILIILLTIISPKANHRSAVAHADEASDTTIYHGRSGGYTVIEFLKDLQHLHSYDNVLLMHNKNTTFASIFYSIISANDTSNSDADADADAVGNLDFVDQILSATTPPLRSFDAHLMQHVQVPVVQLNELQQFYLKHQLTDNLLAIVQIDINSGGSQMTLDQHGGLLQKLSQSLLRMKVAKVLFLFNVPVTMDGILVPAYEDVAKGVVEQLFQHCWRQKLLNVAAILSDYQITRTIYRYTPFPVFKLESVLMATDQKAQKEIYPDRLGDLLGYKMPIVVGGSDPRIIPYEGHDGKLFIGGFVGHFILAFAQKFNCSLHEPLPFNPKSPIPSQDLLQAVRNGSVEWSAGITFPEIPPHSYSYPYEILNWCLMIPVEADIPAYKFFTSVFKGETYILVIGSLVLISMVLSAALYVHGQSPDILDIICHDDCLRGILGQSFTEMANPPKIVRALYLDICVLGILLTATYNAYFSTYVTKAPKVATLNNMDEILASGLKVIAFEPEYKEILSRAPEFKKYSPIFITEKNFLKYLAMRDTFNTEYGYVVPTNKWTIVNEQQKIFTTPLFRQSASFCFYNNIPMCFPVHENSLYKASVYQLILETTESGLMNFWMQNGFMELIKANKLQFSDLSQKNEFRAMKVDDLQYILIFSAAMLVVVILVFVGELMVFYRKQIFGKIKRCCANIARKLRRAAKI